MNATAPEPVFFALRIDAEKKIHCPQCPGEVLRRIILTDMVDFHGSVLN
jgi:hypothetical protein